MNAADLNTLSNDDLNTLVALEIAETHETAASDSLGSHCWEGQQNYRNKRSGEVFGRAYGGNCQIGTGCWPDFCTNFEAVRPLLEAHRFCEIRRRLMGTGFGTDPELGWEVLLHPQTKAPVEVVHGLDPSLAKAAVIALLRARLG